MRLRRSFARLFLLSVLAVPAIAAPPPQNPVPDAQVHSARRAQLLATLPKGAMAVLHSAPQSDDRFSVYRPDSSFWYLTGMPEPETVALLLPDAPEGKRYTLFSAAKDWDKEKWTGYRAGQELAKTRYHADAAYASADFEKRLPELMRGASSLWILDGGDTRFREMVTRAWDRRAANSSVALPIYNLGPTVAQMRLYKDAHEIQMLRHAVALSIDAHLAAMPLARAGDGEWTVRNAMTSICAATGSPRMAYPAIVGSGENSIVLHYDAADRVMREGEMIVNDTGCEYGLYAADITRSYPVGGVFSPEQKAIYEVVLRAQQAAHAKAVVGAQLQDVADASLDTVVDGLLRLGILKGQKAAIIADKSYLAFYPHGPSHWLGLDVHDAGNYDTTLPPQDKPEKIRRFYVRSLAKLQPGMAFTIEPGIYIPPKSEGVDPKWWNIGVRIEDDYLVTPQGTECLSCALPSDIPSIEKLVRKL
jgi:Xaa-Pro aminopeptidase